MMETTRIQTRTSDGKLISFRFAASSTKLTAMRSMFRRQIRCTGSQEVRFPVAWAWLKRNRFFGAMGPDKQRLAFILCRSLCYFV